MTQRNHSEFSLESNPLDFNYPPTQSPSPDVPGSCFPQTVLARKSAVHSTWKDSLAEKVVCAKPLPLGQTSRVWACGLPEWVPLSCCPSVSITHISLPHSTACHGPSTRFIYIVAQQEAGPVLRATLAHWEQIASGALDPGAVGCALNFHFCIRE